ncbi:FCF1 family protein [Spraguea lophii 42_110]|uniref:FCF1 family protein n=1 Tax=Spraguea lophii (strain 42_110) TaxID=1358809 RepID=S7XRN8_SPRLO|nr:FCF1 family protein [Spraguea lophii 42_110]
MKIGRKKFAKIKKVINRFKKEPKPKEEIVNIDPNFNDYFAINESLKPPYNVILDTNFICHSISRRMDIETELMRCLYGNVKIWITECVFGELEKLGIKYKAAVAAVRNIKHHVLICDHKGIYADDCIVNRISVHKCYIIATCDTELKNRIRKVPGIPILYVKGRKYDIERLPVL